MSATAKLPRSVEELTPEWLESALSVRCPGIKVTAATIDKAIYTTRT